MSEKIQSLIDKIKSEGVEAADQKAQEIEQLAQAKAKDILEKAKQQAAKMIQDAQAEITKKEGSSRMALTQASRDTILSLRQNIAAILKKITSQSVGDALSSEALAGIIADIAKDAITSEQKGAVVVSLSPDNQKKLKDDIIGRLQKTIMAGIEVKASDEIGKGFAISFDGGKSGFDFTEESLAEYLSSFLNEEVAAIVKGSTV